MRSSRFRAVLAIALLGASSAFAGGLTIVEDEEPRVAGAPSFVRVHRNAAAPAGAEIARAISSSVDADYLERFPKAEFMLVAHVAVSEAEAAEGEKNWLLSISCGVTRRSGVSPVLAEGYKPEFMVAILGGDLAKEPSFAAKSAARVCRSAQRKAVTFLNQ